MVKHKKYKIVKVVRNGEDAALGDQTYRYLTADEMKSLGDDSLPIDVTRDERIDSNRIDSMLPPQHIEDSFSPEHISNNYSEYISKYTPDNVDINRHPIHIGKLHWKNFLVSFLVDARGGAMRGCRHSGVRVIVPPRCAPSPTRITCRYVRPQRTPHPPPLMEGEALASRILELGPVGAKFLGPVIIEVPHFAALRGKEREIVILRSDNGEAWKEHTVEASEEILNNVLHESFEAEDLNQMEDVASGRITRIVTQDFPQYFAVVSRIRQEVHAIGPEGGMVSSTVVPQVQAIFPEGALTKKIKVGLQAQPIDPELTAKLLGHGVAVSPVVTVEPRRRKFHKAIRLNMPAPTAHSQGMINQYSGSAPTLRLLCSITGGTTRAQWEDVTGSTPLTFVNDVVSFTTTVSARFWLMDCRNVSDATKMATELYKEAIHVPFMAKFVVFAKRVDPMEARLRVFCMTDDKEDKTLEHQEHFTEVAKSRDVEVLEGKSQYVEFSGNLVPVTKSGDQLQFAFRAFRENRLPFSVRVKDQHAEAVGRCLFMREPKIPRGEPAQQPICILNIVLPDDIVTDTISLTDSESGKRHMYLSEFQDYYKPDPRLADMSNLLGDDWVELAHQLGLTSSEINVIKSEYPESVAKQAQSMLRMWLSQSGNKVHTNTLENALKRIGREDIIPQCLNVEQPFARIKEDVPYRSRGKEEEKRKITEQYDKYSAEEKVVVKSESEEEEDTFDRTVTERREQIEKRLSAERAIPASAQRKEIVQEISDIKRQSLVEEKVAEVMQKVETKPGKTISETVEIKTTLPSKGSEIVVETRETKFVEEVSSRFDGPQAKAEQSVEGGKLSSKTPPPSPADFLLQKQATTAPEWNASRKSTEPTSPTAIVDQAAAQQEISCGLTPAEPLPLTTAPQPKPRTSKPDIPLDLAKTPPKTDKIMSPVRDDLLDEDDFATYSDRKQFWENVTKETAHKRMSLHEVSSRDSSVTSKKRSSVHEIAPIPKPRENKPQTEYQASFTPPSDRKVKLSQQSTDDSLDSDRAQKGSSQQIEHTGYISDSEDVENVISDSEIEDRVPQIRERQMSVCVAPQRKTIYERSASLPTEDLYEVSRNLKQLKEKYEQKIRDDMIEEQFGGNEEEHTPETKTLATMQEERIFKELVDKSETEGSEKGEEIPEITVTLSGKQRRISEESDKFDNAQTVEEHIVWETAIETQPEDKPAEMEQIILDTFQDMKVDPDEAKIIATQLIQEIENELQNRSEPIDPEMSTYIRKLAETNGLDQREVELVESVLARRQRELARGDTQASSLEITDEDLRYSGAEITDYSNTLEQQIGQLEAERSLIEDSLERETKLSVEVERTHSEHKNVIFEEDETISELEEEAKLITHVEASGSELMVSKSDSEETTQTTTTSITGDSTVKHVSQTEEIESKDFKKSKLSASSSDESQITGQSSSHHHLKDDSKEVLTNVELQYEEVKKQEERKLEVASKSDSEETTQTTTTSITGDSTVKQVTQSEEVESKDCRKSKLSMSSSDESQISGQSTSHHHLKDSTKEVLTNVEQQYEEVKKQEEHKSEVVEQSKDGYVKATKVVVTDLSSEKVATTTTVQRTSSSDSNSFKSPDRVVTFRNSSGESHYQSFDSGRSRPCSSDVEAVIAASSEYNTAHDNTSTDYHTAISSLDSESSGNLASIEVSRSETLVPSSSDPDQQMIRQDSDLISDLELEHEELGVTKMKRSAEMTFQPELSLSTSQKTVIEGCDASTSTLHEDFVIIDNVTITTTSVKEDGVHSASTQITSETVEPKKKGHRRTESISLPAKEVEEKSFATTSSEKSSFEEGEAEAAFSMVAHISPAHKVKQIIPIMEDEDAEKLELELKEKQRKELESRRSEVSPAFIPDITVTDTTPEDDSSDSFEMLEKPDIIDDFVVIEEVGKEAQEFDTEGKSVNIDTTTKIVKKFDEDMEKYLAHSAPTPLTGRTTSLDELEFEDSPPRPDGSVSTREYGYEYDKELENNKQWIEKQFQGDRAAMIAAGYGYEMEFERGPLEDIKEEDIADFASSYGSQKESVKDSYSSTPEYDVLAGRRYFTRSGDQDDISMNSLQEFEKLEQAMSLEMRRFHQGSDSSSSGSSKTRFNHHKDDISVSSLKEFEGLEHACIQAHTIEVKAKEEEAALGQIDEASESESCTTEKKISETDDEDYEKRMFEIDAIIKQAQSNVERFIDLKEMEKTESLGRGDSYEEVSKVPELELDTPAVKCTIKVQWKEGEDVMETSTDSLELLQEEERRDSADSLDVPVGDVMTASTDSIEFQAQKEVKMILSDSLELGGNIIQTDSMEDFSSSLAKEEPSTSATTHATGSNTMISSTDTMVDVDTTAKRVWFNEDYSGQMEEPYVSEVMEPLDDPEYSHIIHRKTEFPPEIRKITFTGPDADQRLKHFMEQFGEGEDVEESEEIDEDGNVHTKRVVQKRFVLQDYEAGSVPPPSQPDETSTSKAETEEVQDQEKKVPDQHQLSDEMKELLKELERDSKQ